MIPPNNHMREVSQLCHVEDNQRLWRDQLVKHHIRSPDLMLLLQLSTISTILGYGAEKFLKKGIVIK